MRPAGVLILLILITGVASAVAPPWMVKPGPPPRFPEILVGVDWLEKHARDRDLVIVDARPAERFARGHIPGAVSCDAAACDPDPATLGARLGAAGIPDRGTVVCYGDARDPVAAGRLFWLLELAGQRGARVLNGGLEAWGMRGNAGATGPAPFAPRRFQTRADTSRIADYDYVRQAFGVKGHTLADWRPDSAWSAGHIPQSLPFPLAKLTGPDGTWLDGRHMRPVFEVFGPRRNEYVDLADEFIVCGDAPAGGAPIHPYLAARVAAIARVRCYPGGSSEWISRPGSPVTRIVDAATVRARISHGLWDRLRRAPPRDAVLFDLRERGDYRAGHLPGAVLQPAYTFEQDFEAAVAKHWPHADKATTPLIVYCYGPDCTRSRNCTTIAARHGWRDLWWFKEGTQGWRGAGYELETGE